MRLTWPRGAPTAISPGLIHHADHGSNYTAMVYIERTFELGPVPSTGTVGDSFDDAMAETVNNSTRPS